MQLNDTPITLRMPPEPATLRGLRKHERNWHVFVARNCERKTYREVAKSFGIASPNVKAIVAKMFRLIAIDLRDQGYSADSIATFLAGQWAVGDDLDMWYTIYRVAPHRFPAIRTKPQYTNAAIPDIQAGWELADAFVDA